MASTNFKIFNEGMSADRTFSDAEYEVATQRQGGVIPGMALSRLHNKLYRQSTAMAKAIADFLVEQGRDCLDNDVPGITTSLQAAILNIASGQASSEIETHNTSTNAHTDLLHLWQSGKAYKVGDIVYSPNLPSYAYAECIVAGTSGANEPIWPAVAEEVTDGTVRWRIRDIKSGSGMPIGSILAYPVDSIPAGYLKCNGAAVGRVTYPELFALIGTTYGAGDGSTTFNVPDLRGEFIRGWGDGRNVDSGRVLGSAQRDALQTHDHFLPTSTGLGDARWCIPDTIWKASNGNEFPVDGNNTAARTYPGSSAGTFASETRPRNVAMLYCIKAFDAPVNQGLIDITELANDVAGKAVISSGPGWTKYSDGTLTQEGNGITDAVNGAVNMTFPVVFYSTTYGFCANESDASTWTQQGMATLYGSAYRKTSGLQVICKKVGANIFQNGISSAFSWIAKGRWKA